ncbi:MAG TPA: response regulator transcription factor [Solirubrobacteraceae bacterium]|nr:response regulator transcription factor [Solirubrobacteraceae bacterium]
MQIRVLIVDDSPLMRVGLARSLEGEPDITLVATAGDAHEALRLAHELRPDVVLLDLHMPEIGGQMVLERLREQLPEVRTLIVTASEAPQSLLDAVAAGAAGYLTKRASPEELREAIVSVHSGNSVITPELAGHLLHAYAGRASGATDRRSTLTRREQDVLRLVAQGHTDKEIGRALHLSPRTVQTHLTRIREKTGARRRAELATWASDNTLV